MRLELTTLLPCVRVTDSGASVLARFSLKEVMHWLRMSDGMPDLVSPEDTTQVVRGSYKSIVAPADKGTANISALESVQGVSDGETGSDGENLSLCELVNKDAMLKGFSEHKGWQMHRRPEETFNLGSDLEALFIKL
jgi:hypothetical protein